MKVRKMQVKRCVKRVLSLGLKNVKRDKERAREGARKSSLYKRRVTYLWKGI